MDNRNEVREFLVSRRARITPREAGLPEHAGGRRVPGLRREEVAMLAGPSVDYYVRLERGNLGGVSESVLESLTRALRLDDVERAHLHDLARGPRRAARRPVPRIRPGVERLLAAITTPAVVRNGRFDVVATNPLGRALYAPVFDTPVRAPGRPANHARFVFLDPYAPEFFGDWEGVASDVAAILHAEAGRDPHDRALTALVGDLSTRSEVFATWWARHDVRLHDTGVKRLHHPVVGDLTLSYEAMALRADADLTLFVYGVEPGSESEDGLRLLASWSAPEAPEIPEITDVDT